MMRCSAAAPDLPHTHASAASPPRAVNPVSVVLVLASALTHVYWNYELKRATLPAAYTVWLMGIGALLAAGPSLLFASHHRVPLVGWACVAGTGALYAAYYYLLARGYDHDDLSRIYPIARGVAPAATAGLGSLFFAERPSLPGWLGIAAVSCGVLLLCLPGRASECARPITLAGLAAAVGTGLCTSGYSAIDKLGVRHVDPAIYLTLTFAVGAAAQGAILVPRYGPARVMEEARRGGARLWLAAALSVGGYLLILHVLRTEPVSYVVPLRSVAVLLSVLAGNRLLGEEGGWSRTAAAALIVAGIAAIALAG
jgi:drug/metabolite transporter (DMT)-like permease